jgi:hypothetical protein
MLGAMKVLSGVLVFRRIAAAHVPARQTEAKMHPPIASLQALFASSSVGLNILDLI